VHCSHPQCMPSTLPAVHLATAGGCNGRPTPRVAASKEVACRIAGQQWAKGYKCMIVLSCDKWIARLRTIKAHARAWFGCQLLQPAVQ
jgi:hypothetical protein